MLFNIEEDLGSCLVFYIVPDDYSSIPRCLILSNNIILGSFEANEFRMSLIHAGRHETGQCGFRLTNLEIPNLENLADLTIQEENSGVSIYRRRQNVQIEKRVLRLETHLFPLQILDRILGRKFQYFEQGIEGLGRETTTQLFLLNNCPSVYLSGRIFFKNLSYQIDQGFDVIAVIQPPHIEFVERLKVLSIIGELQYSFLGEREQKIFEPAIEFASKLKFENPESFLKQLRKMPSSVELLLAEPLTRQLTASAPDEMPKKGSFGVAIEVLASARLLGFRQDPDIFLNALIEYFDIESSNELLTSIPRFDALEPLATLLQENRFIDHLIEQDLDVFSEVWSVAKGYLRS